MGLIDFILNLAGVLLWLSARSLRFDPLVKTSAASLAGTLRRAAPNRLRAWHFLAMLAGLLFCRAVIYGQIGPAVNWTPNLRLGAIVIAFRSDMFGRMLLFSVLSFALTLGVFYLWCLFLSLVNGGAADTNSLQRLVTLHLGRVAQWPWQVKLILPLAVVVVLWLGLGLLLTRWELIPPAASAVRRMEEGLVLGLGAYLTWKFVIAGCLVFFVFSSYIYFGSHPFWNFVGSTGHNLVRPLTWLPLRAGKVDFTPVLEIALVFAASEFAERGLTLLYRRLPM
jgi:uncharacterized protein YggT (Ycf19 family)